MKIMTLNADFLRTDHDGRKLRLLAEGILQERPDVIAMQKFYRLPPAMQIPDGTQRNLHISEEKIHRDHPVAKLVQYLYSSGMECSWAWANTGGTDREEGTAILCPGRKIRNTDQFPISGIARDPRTVLGVQLEGSDDWFYSLYMNPWEDHDESFLEQWKRLNSCIASKRLCSAIWLAGDFNAAADMPDQSYQHMLCGGWQDTYAIARHKDQGITRMDADQGIRSDYIMCNQKKEILSSGVIFNGEKGPVLSNHFGVIIEVKEQTA